MKANKTHISLETAKLLKDCGIESEYVYCKYIEDDIIFINKRVEYENGFGCNGYEKESLNLFPVFTWQEILWENTDKFFGGERKEIIFDGKNYSVLVEDVEPYQSKKPIGYPFDNKYNPTAKILLFLQQKKYQEADEYFRSNCILIEREK